MREFFQNPRTSSILGFVFLPIVLILLCIGANLFAPEFLKFPTPKIVFAELIHVVADESVRTILMNTFQNVFVALFCSLLLGIILGLIMGGNDTIWSFSQPTVDFFRSIPVTFLIPAAALLIGSTSANIVWLLATYPCILIMIINVHAGLERQSKNEKERIHAFKIISGSTNPINLFYQVTIREISQEILTGFRVALSYCIVIVTVLEYLKLGNTPGIGGLIGDELSNQNYPRVYALIFLIGIIGFILNKIAEIIEYWLLSWSKKKCYVISWFRWKRQ